MPKRDTVQEAVESVALAARDPESSQSMDIFKRALRGHNLAAARAAQAAGEHRLGTLIPDLASAFSYFMTNCQHRDPLCAAKLAIAEALDRLEYDESALFLTGLRHVQMEKAWGEMTDTAARLRARSVAALVRLNHPDRYRFLADLLFDPCTEARRGAIQAAAFAGGDAAEMLLRVKAQMGDKDATITADCLTALLQVAPEASVNFVGRWLRSPQLDLREFAALALGEARSPGGFELLSDAIAGVTDPNEFQTLALSISLYRSPEALALLIEWLERKPLPLAGAALKALALFQHDEQVWQQVAQTTARRGLRLPAKD